MFRRVFVPISTASVPPNSHMTKAQRFLIRVVQVPSRSKMSAIGEKIFPTRKSRATENRGVDEGFHLAVDRRALQKPYREPARRAAVPRMRGRFAARWRSSKRGSSRLSGEHRGADVEKTLRGLDQHLAEIAGRLDDNAARGRVAKPALTSGARSAPPIRTRAPAAPRALDDALGGSRSRPDRALRRCSARSIPSRRV